MRFDLLKYGDDFKVSKDSPWVYVKGHNKTYVRGLDVYRMDDPSIEVYIKKPTIEWRK